jgi:hypothetical protein
LLSGLPKQERNKLQSVQNAAAPVIACLRKKDHITDTLKDLHWLPVEQRIVFKLCRIVFKTLNNLALGYLKDILQYYRPSRILRSSGDQLRLIEPSYNLKSYGLRAFTVIAPRVWNKLPLDIRSSTSVNMFKSKSKTYLYKTVYDV